jgi:LysM repeat protein
MFRRRKTGILAVTLILLAAALLPAPGAHAQEDAPGGSPTIHTVARGETLYRISQIYDVPIAWIVVANNIPNPARIEVGQQLIIPRSEEEATASGGEILYHIVKPGEYLSQIAQQYGISAWTLAQANGIANPSLIYTGQVLRITTVAADPPPATPEPSAVPSTPTPEPTETPTPPAPVDPPEPPPAPPAGGTYTVQAGDTLGKIARLYAVSIAELARMNGIVNVNLIHVGQTLTIPEPPPPPTPSRTEGKQIVVVLSTQRTYAFEDGVMVAEFIVSTGRAATPTVQGEFAIYLKYTSTRMRGPGYDLPNVPWTMYFYRGYGLHGTYWHNNFGTPMSHGCVNLRTPDAEWLFNWAPMGTSVLVIP